MEKIKLYLVFIVFTVLCISCSKQAVSPEEYLEHCQNKKNGLIQKIEFQGMEFKLFYKPAEYIVAQQIAKDHNSINVDSLRNKIGDLVYFDLEIKSNDSKDNPLINTSQNQVEYQEKLIYFMNHFQKDIFLIQEGDTIVPSIFHFERNFNISNNLRFLMAFESGSRRQSDITILINEKAFGLGRLKFLIREESIENLPELKI